MTILWKLLTIAKLVSPELKATISEAVDQWCAAAALSPNKMDDLVTGILRGFLTIVGLYAKRQ